MPSSDDVTRYVNSLLRGTLARAKQTEGECHAAVWMKRRGGGGEWYKWSTCSLDPGHDGSHVIWSERDSSEFWHPWNDGDEGIQEDKNYGELIRTEWRTEPSPWTAAEIAQLNDVEGG